MSRHKGHRRTGEGAERKHVLILTNLEVVRQSKTDLCHLGLFRAPAELFDVSDVGWGGQNVF